MRMINAVSLRSDDKCSLRSDDKCSKSKVGRDNFARLTYSLAEFTRGATSLEAKFDR